MTPRKANPSKNKLFILTILAALFLSLNFASQASARHQICEIFDAINDVKEARSLGISPHGLCQAYGMNCFAADNYGQAACYIETGSNCSGADNLSEAICKIWGGSSCYQANLGEAVCQALGGSGCGSVTNLGQGVCKGSGASGCSSITNFGQGACKALAGQNCLSVTTHAEIRYWKKQSRRFCGK